MARGLTILSPQRIRTTRFATTYVHQVTVEPSTFPCPHSTDARQVETIPLQRIEHFIVIIARELVARAKIRGTCVDSMDEKVCRCRMTSDERQ